MNRDDDIEILDIFDKKETSNNTVSYQQTNTNLNNNQNSNFSSNQNSNINTNVNKSSNVKVKRKLKGSVFQIIFCSISALFILGCCIFYGYRFIKYYKIYNPKINTGEGEIMLSNYITGQSEIVYDGDGLYISSGTYTYKGNVTNNYLEYNNLLWRIVRINQDGTILLVLDDYMNILPWNSKVNSFSASDINKYLNDNFVKNIDTSVLDKNTYCDDTLTDLTNIQCTKQVIDSYVTLLDVNSFLNSVKENKSYLVSDDEIFWLNNSSNDKIWHTNGTNVSMSDASILYEIRPVIKLKSLVMFQSGDGTKEKPYTISKDNKIGLGSTIKLGDDQWIIYEMGDTIKLMSEKVLDKTYIFDKNDNKYDVNSKESLAEYLNTTYLDSLSYKDMIIDGTWYNGSLTNNINDVKSSKVTCKVGVPNLLDIKINSGVKEYFTMTSKEDYVLVYENPLRPSKPTTNRSVRPCITLKKGALDSFVYQNGVFVKEAK